MSNNALTRADDRLASLVNSPWFSCLIYGVILCVYLLVPANNWTYADDSLRWAFGLAQTEGVVNSHHLYLNVLRPVYHFIVSSLAFDIEPESFLSFYSSLCGLLGLYFLHQLLCLLGKKSLAMWGVLFTAATSGYWLYSIVGDCYVPAAAFFLGGVLFYLRSLSSSDSRSRLHLLLISSLCFVVMILHHQAMFLGVVGLALVTVFSGHFEMRSRLSSSFGVLLFVGLFSLCAYLMTYFFIESEENKERGAVGYMVGYADSFVAYPDMKELSVMSVIRGGIGMGRATVTTNFMYGFESVRDGLQEKFPYRHTYNYTYLIRDLSASALNVVLVFVVSSLLIIGVLALLGLVKIIQVGGAAAILLGGASVLALFFIWWEAMSDEFWIWFMPVLGVLIVFGVDVFKRYKHLIMACLIGFLSVSTYVGSVSVYASSSNDIDAVNYKFLDGIHEGSLLVSMDEIVTNARIRLMQLDHDFSYINIFTKASKGKVLDVELINAKINNALLNGRKVYVSPYFSKPPLSYLAQISNNSSTFHYEYQAILSNLESKEGVVWLQPVIAPEGYF